MIQNIDQIIDKRDLVSLNLVQFQEKPSFVVFVGMDLMYDNIHIFFYLLSSICPVSFSLSIPLVFIT